MLDHAVLPGRVGAGAVTPTTWGFHGAREVSGTVFGTLIGDFPVGPGDSLGDQESHRTPEEANRDGRFLILKGLGVGQARETVQDRVQVGVAV